VNCGFTLDHYLECLSLADCNDYKIIPVSDYFKLQKDEKAILLRHDVDFSLDYAYEMASMEHAIGYAATYYVLLHSPCYNALSPNSMDAIKAIHGLGHEIGLQVDSRYHLNADLETLSEIVGGPVNTYAKHYYTITEDIKIPFLVDSRNPGINAKYISESGRNWREGCLCQHINKHDRLQVLTHPIWWTTETENRDDAVTRLHEHLIDKQNDAIYEYRNILAQYIKDENIA
jgi:hypothetical protein